jgi:hypothetical protein
MRLWETNLSDDPHDSPSSKRSTDLNSFIPATLYRDYIDYLKVMTKRKLPPSALDFFLMYKRKKLNSIVQLEKQRLEDLGKSRSTVYKYALPATLIDGLAGTLASQVSSNIFVLIPTVVFALVIFQLAHFIDRTKELDKLNLIQESRRSLLEVRRQEAELLMRS